MTRAITTGKKTDSKYGQIAIIKWKEHFKIWSVVKYISCHVSEKQNKSMPLFPLPLLIWRMSLSIIYWFERSWMTLTHVRSSQMSVIWAVKQLTCWEQDGVMAPSPLMRNRDAGDLLSADYDQYQCTEAFWSASVIQAWITRITHLILL